LNPRRLVPGIGALFALHGEVIVKRPVQVLTVLACAMGGAFVGSGSFTFVSAKGYSYLSNESAVCVNCHIMREQYDGWRQSSHHATASCNDCHLPNDNAVHNLYVKASNGYRHSKAFTLQNFEEPIRIVPSNSKVLEGNCLRCHADMIDAITAHGTLGAAMGMRGNVDLYGCVRCHVDVGHGPRR
jgi:cytochrome c nitrite reductase small subunit